MMLFSNAIPKIATMINDSSDAIRLLNLLEKNKERPKCILGMGQDGIKTRLVFPAMGSCLTYGFIDSECAPGQSKASLLKRMLAVIMQRS